MITEFIKTKTIGSEPVERLEPGLDDEEFDETES